MSGFEEFRKMIGRGIAGVKVAMSEGRVIQIPGPTNPKRPDASAAVETLYELLRGMAHLSPAFALHANEIMSSLGQLNEDASSMRKAAPQVVDALGRAAEALKAAKEAAPEVSKGLFSPLEEKLGNMKKFFDQMKDFEPGPEIVEETILVHIVGPKGHVEKTVQSINKAVDETELSVVIKAGVEHGYRLGLTTEDRGRKLVASKDGVQYILSQNQLDANDALNEAGLGLKEQPAAS